VKPQSSSLEKQEFVRQAGNSSSSYTGRKRKREKKTHTSKTEITFFKTKNVGEKIDINGKVNKKRKLNGSSGINGARSKALLHKLNFRQ